jgi:hypothetical protein
MKLFNVLTQQVQLNRLLDATPSTAYLNASIGWSDVLYTEMFSSQAEDLSMGRRTVSQSPVFPPSCQFYPERATSENSDHGKQSEVVTKHWDKDLPAPLELILNIKTDVFNIGTAMPKFLKAATTKPYQCYIAPVCSTV